MKDLIVTIFGIYEPVTTAVYDASGAVVGQAVASGVAGVDWPYLAGILLFALVLYSFFRLLGMVLK
ncbi:MAG: hypothetical protein HFF09_00640 [Oscillospiraceae bacterium]|nr:hypothetical protein [Oscillospiraceae bacterium]